MLRKKKILIGAVAAAFLGGGVIVFTTGAFGINAAKCSENTKNKSADCVNTLQFALGSSTAEGAQPAESKAVIPGQTASTPFSVDIAPNVSPDVLDPSALSADSGGAGTTSKPRRTTTTRIRATVPPIVTQLPTTVPGPTVALDKIAPTGFIAMPAKQYSVQSGTAVTFGFSVHDNVWTTKVEVQISDGTHPYQTIGNAGITPWGWFYVLDTTKYANKLWGVKGILYDAAGNRSETPPMIIGINN